MPVSFQRSKPHKFLFGDVLFAELNDWPLEHADECEVLVLLFSWKHA